MARTALPHFISAVRADLQVVSRESALSLPLHSPVVDALSQIGLTLPAGWSVEVSGGHQRAGSPPKRRDPRAKSPWNVDDLDVPALDLPAMVSVMEHAGIVAHSPDDVWFGSVGVDGRLKSARGVAGVLMTLSSGETLHTSIEAAQQAAPFTRGARIIGYDSIDDVIAGRGVEVFADVAGVPPRAGIALPRLDADTLRRMVVIASGGHAAFFIGDSDSHYGRSVNGLIARSIETMRRRSIDDLMTLAAIDSLTEMLYYPVTRYRIATIPSSFKFQHRTGPSPLAQSHTGVVYMDDVSGFDIPTADSIARAAQRGEHSGWPADFILLGSVRSMDWMSDRGREYARRRIGSMPWDIELHPKSAPPEGPTIDARDALASIMRSRIARRQRGQTKLNGRLSREDFVSSDDPISVSSVMAGLTLDDSSTLRLLRVARTIADIEGSTSVEARHIDEAEVMVFKSTQQEASRPTSVAAPSQAGDSGSEKVNFNKPVTKSDLLMPIAAVREIMRRASTSKPDPDDLDDVDSAAEFIRSARTDVFERHAREDVDQMIPIAVERGLAWEQIIDETERRLRLNALEALIADAKKRAR